jgi:hypothetical protein
MLRRYVVEDKNVEDYTIPLPVEDVEKFVNQFTKRLRIDGV